MAFTALTDARLAAKDALVMQWVLECRSGAQARASAALTAIPLTGVPTIRRGGSGLYASAEFAVDRDWAGDALAYSDDYDPANPLQTGSEVRLKCRVRVAAGPPEVWEEGYVFRGFAQVVRLEDEKLSVTAYDRLAVCKRCVATVALESETLEPPFTGNVTLKVDPGDPNGLVVDNAVHPTAWYNGSPRSWKTDAVHLYKWDTVELEWLPLASDNWNPYYQEGKIQLSEDPGASYRLEQEGASYTLACYRMPGEAGVLLVGDIIKALLHEDTAPKWVDAGGGLVTAGLGPGFTDAELAGLADGFGVSEFYWTPQDGSVEEALLELLGERYSGAYKLYYDPAADQVVGLDESAFKAKADAVAETPPVYDLDALYWVKQPAAVRDLEEVNAAVLVQGTLPQPEPLLSGGDAAKITNLLAAGWTLLDLKPFQGWNALANLLNGKYAAKNNAVGFGVRKSGEIGVGHDFLEIDLGQDENLGTVVLAGPVTDTGTTQVQVYIYACDEASYPNNYRVISGEADGGLLGVNQVKAYDVEIAGKFRYLKIRQRAERLMGSGHASDGIIALAEVQVHAGGEASAVVAIQETDAGEADTYYPALVDKYYVTGAPVKHDDREFTRTEADLTERAQRLVFWGVRAPRGYVVESQQVDPRALLYQTVPLTCRFNQPAPRPVLIEAVEISANGTRIEATDYYTEGWI